MSAVWIAVVLVFAASEARADDASEAAAESDRAMAAYTGGEYSAAIEGYQNAYRLDPQPEYLFGWAQSLRKHGDCAKALPLYKKLLTLKLEDDRREATRIAMAPCAAEPRTPTKPVEPIKQPPPPKPVVDEPGWYSDWRADLVTALGIAVAGTGAYLTIRSVSDERAARDATVFDDHQRLGDRATLERITGIAAIGAGTLAAAYGVYRYTHHKHAAVTAWIAPHGGGIAIGASWP